jgi:glutamate 5-kinase
VKRWSAYSDSFTKSKLVINEGALKALLSKKANSLLPVGVTSVDGSFKKGDLLKIVTEEGNFVGMGKSQYSSERFKKEKLTNRQKPVVHYDYLYLEDIKINSELK